MLGPNFAIVSACATGAHAIGEAWETIRRDDADIMLAGGTEAAIHEAVVGGFASMKALSTRNDDPEAASRPFDQGRDGFVIGEGAGVLVLEELAHAEARGATPLAELVGYGATADASHITLPAPGGIGAVRAGRRALEKAGMEPDEIDHVNAHATSTPEGDGAELQALATLLGEHAPASRSRPRSRCSATRSARPARSSRSRRSRRCARAASRRRSTSTIPTEHADGLDLTPERRRSGRSARRSQLVRVRRPERGARLPAVGRMTRSERTEAAPMTETASPTPRAGPRRSPGDDAAPVAIAAGRGADGAAGDASPRPRCRATPRSSRSSTGCGRCSTGAS